MARDFYDVGRLDEQDFVVDRVKNNTNSAEGSVLPPRQVGANRVPIVTNLRVLTQSPILGGTSFVIGFNTPTTAEIREYKLYYAINGSSNYVDAGFTKDSPARFNIIAGTSLRVAFVIQTVLKNGFTSAFSSSPSCTGITAPGIIVSNSTASLGVDPTTHTSNFTVGDYWLTPVDTSGGPVNVQLPSAGGIPGRWYIIKKTTGDANALAFVADGSDTIDGAATASITTAYGLVSVVRLTPTAWGII
jgi:hypothetical protein